MSSGVVSESDARAMVRLVGEAAAVAATSNYRECRKFLLKGLCEMIGADAWIWSLTRVDHETQQIYYLSNDNGGMDDGQWEQLRAVAEHPSTEDAARGFGMALTVTQKPITMNRTQIDPEDKINQGEVAELWQSTGFQGMIMSGHPLDKESYSHLVIYRNKDKAEFDLRETQIAHIVLSEVPWLHAMGWPEDRGATIPKLSPRQRSVLNMLTKGYSRKEMAYALEISENTVSGYVKEVYRHFGVHSQTDLVRKFMGVDQAESNTL